MEPDKNSIKEKETYTMKNSMNNGAANNYSNNAGGRIIMANGTIQTMEVFVDTVNGDYLW